MIQSFYHKGRIWSNDLQKAAEGSEDANGFYIDFIDFFGPERYTVHTRVSIPDTLLNALVC